jgi:hypothetical protein
MALYETHFCISTGNVYVHLNSSSAADHKDIFSNLPLKTPVKMVFSNVILTAPPTPKTKTKISRF